MNPVKYANELIKTQGFERAYEISLMTMRNIEAVGSGGIALGDEVELSEQTVRDAEGKTTTKTITVVDEAAKAARQNKTLAFWKNVYSYLKARKPAKAA